MVSLYDSGIYLVNGTEIVPESESGKVKKLTGRDADQASARKGTKKIRCKTPMYRPTAR